MAIRNISCKIGSICLGAVQQLAFWMVIRSEHLFRIETLEASTGKKISPTIGQSFSVIWLFCDQKHLGLEVLSTIDVTPLSVFCMKVI